MNAKIRTEATNRAGYRERYAMTHGKETRRIENGRTLFVFKYSTLLPYQDANGATYDATTRAWIA